MNRFSLCLLMLSCAMQPTMAAERQITIVTLGDSITKGVRQGVTAEETYSHLLEQRLAGAEHSIRVINQGVGGETTAGALARLDQDVFAARPDLVTIMYGTNDCYVDPGKTESRLSLAEYQRNLEELLRRVRAAGAEPILMTEPCYAGKSPVNGLGEHGNVRLARYMEVCRHVAARRDIILVDNFAEWTAVMEAGQAIEPWTTDGYHPNPLGHARIAETMFQPVADAASGIADGVVDFETRLEEVLSHDDGKSLWYHPRAVVFPNHLTAATTAEYLITLQRHLLADDHYDGLATSTRTHGGWTPPTAEPALAWRKDETGATIAVCDVTPGYHESTGKVIALGAKILYDDAGKQLNHRRHAHQVAYAIYTPGHEPRWSPWQILELPDTDDRYFLATPGCAQWIVDDLAGNILLPVYHKGPTGDAYSVTVMRCAFDGERMTLLEAGKTLELGEVRGLCEPSLARFRGRYYLTLRNDLRGYVTASDDGLKYAPLTPWLFDDGNELDSYNTQQHWLAHSDALFLVYTRRGVHNDHIFRHRAPLLMARVDAGALRVIRVTEKILIPERGGEFGNFGANPVSPIESWVTVGEGVWNADARQRGAKGTVFVAHIEWSKPNRLRGGSGPGRFVNLLRPVSAAN